MLIIANNHTSVGFKGTDQLLEGSKNVFRQAAIAREKDQATRSDPQATERPAAYGTPTEAETHTDNTTRKRRSAEKPAYVADNAVRERHATEDSASTSHHVGRQVDTEA